MGASMSDSGPAPTVAKGDLIRLDYELWGEFGGKRELLDTTLESAAKAAHADAPANVEFRPRAFVVGKELFPGSVGKIEGALEGAKVGDEVVRKFAAGDAFGERDPELVESFSTQRIYRLPEMRREDAHLDLGTVLNIGGRSGRVSLITAGRVKVDFNRPQAGRQVEFKFKVLEKVSEPSHVVTTVLDMEYGKGSEFDVKVQGDEVSVGLPDRALFDLNWLVAKARVVEDLRALLKVQKVSFTEEHKTPAPKEKPAAKAGAKAQAPPAVAPAAEGAEAGSKA